MKFVKWLKTSPRNRGIALIIVVGALALTTILLLAMFSVTETEYKATQSYVSAQTAKQLADVAVAVVQAQIQNGQNTGKGAGRTTHATQPGAVTVFDSTGAFLRGHKLYSSSNMVATTLASLVRDNDSGGTPLVPANWDTPANAARFVDLNEPVVRAALSGAASATAVYFPVIDPRAAYNFIGAQSEEGVEPAMGTATTKVEGFSYVKGKKGNGWSQYAADYNGVVTPAEKEGLPNELRLPMPVEWMYVLRDGTFGTLDANNKFQPAPTGSAATAANPIVGRIAFWADDESCKVNINTASEPTYMGTPYYFHDRDRMWAHYPPATGEYQRYPGHPATVALSAVLCPYYRLDPVNPDAGLTRAQIRDLKDQIYDLAPKLARGGSECGTIPFVLPEAQINQWGDLTDKGTISVHVDLATAANERLYASVDELLFNRDGLFTPTGRGSVPVAFPIGDRTIFDHDTLERTRFFLTASSRAPEFSIHGLPRVCIWPVADESKGPSWRTNFDNMIALCATLKNSQGGPASYFFRRLEPHSATADVKLPRNNQLLKYIESELSKLNFPKTGVSGNSTNFGDSNGKYGLDNVRQIALEIFDYIRCTNLYDGVLARGNDGSTAPGTAAASWKPRYDYADSIAPARYTYTNQRVTKAATGDDDKTGTVTTSGGSADANVLPGHGTVTPSVWENGKRYRGFGRFITLSEVGFHFICTADGKNDGPKSQPTSPSYDPTDESYAVGANKSADYGEPFSARSGGGSAVRVDQSFDANPVGGFRALTNANRYTAMNVDQNAEARWWSNFPPLIKNPPGDDIMALYGCDSSKPANPSNNSKHPAYHPGFNPENWNLTLEADTPLKANEKRIQANIDIETFCPMLGWTKFYPEFAIELDGDYIAQIKVKNAAGSFVPLFDTTAGVIMKSNATLFEASGVHALGGHAGPAALFSGRASRAIAGAGTVLMGSDPNYDSSGSGIRAGLNNYTFNSNFITVLRDQPLEVTFPSRPMKITIYDSHDTSRQPVQIISIRFPDVTAPTPLLASPIPYVLPLSSPPVPGINNYRVFVSNSTLTYRRGLQGPHWWSYNELGALGRMRGTPNPAWTKGGEEPFWTQAPVLKPDDGSILQETRGRLHNQISILAPAAGGFTPQGSATGAVIGTPDSISDVVRTMVPAVGDYRVIAAMFEVPETMWVPHPMWREQMGRPPLQQLRTIHSYTNLAGNSEPGYRLGVRTDGATDPVSGAESPPPTADNKLALVSKGYQVYNTRFPSDANNRAAWDSRLPDLPGQEGWAVAANSFGDFDTGISTAREGPYVNKPDEGNYYANSDARSVNGVSVTRFYRSGYFYASWRQMDDWRNGIYMTPNRLISSPVTFGSLSTGVWNTGGNQPAAARALSGASFGTEAGINHGTFPARPWQTLLFRPHSTISTPASVGGKSIHPGQLNPMDHYVLDLFFMPVVEPYAISEPLSVAGRLNMNYQILPFTNIRRATGMHAVMKGELVTAIPQRHQGLTDFGTYTSKNFKDFTPGLWDTFWNEISQTANDTGPKSVYGASAPYPQPNNGVYWYRPINVTETLAQFDERFKGDATDTAASRRRGAFRSASQICEIHLVPGRGQTEAASAMMTNITNMNSATRQQRMDNFWSSNPATGDNVRERPYSNIYSRITNRSNTFRVHVRAQVIKKARSTDPDTMDSEKDAVLSEYRGSALLERYIDPNDAARVLPDYASGDPLTKDPLDTFYQYRVLETKRFSP